MLFVALAALIAAGCAAAAGVAAEPVIEVEVLDVAPAEAASLPTTTIAPSTRTIGTTTTTRPLNLACVNHVSQRTVDLSEQEDLVTRITTALNHPGFAGHDVALSVWVEGWGEVIAHNADLALQPASNQKLLVAIAANEILDIDAPLTTDIELVGNDLVVRAGADPNLNFSRLIEAINTSLITTGPSIDRLVIDVSEYPQATQADGWREWHVPQFVGPLSGFMLENNRWTGGEEIIDDPDATNAARLVELLPEDVSVGAIQVTRGDDAPPPGELLASVESASVGSLVHTMLVASDNQNADLLLMELGRVGVGTGNFESGAYVIDTVLADLCAPVDGTIDDGSGLSRDNFRSAGSFVETLARIHGTPEGDLLRSQLPVGGVSGTLAGRFGGPYAGRVQAKTGTIRTSRALTGWAEMSSGRDAIFSIIVNSRPTQVETADPASAPAMGPALSAIDELIRQILDS